MPIYVYRCPFCLKAEDHYRTVDERNDAPECHRRKMERVFTPPMIFVSPDVHYQSPIDGRPITSMAARKEDMARSNCIEYDPMMRQDYTRRIEREDAALETAVSDTVDAEIARMPARKRENLEAEMVGGMDLTAERITPNVKPLRVELPNG